MRAVVFGTLVGAAVAQGPVKKVVDLLKDMKAETEANQKTDAETFKKLECWCKKTLKETTAGIEEANDCIATQRTNEESGTGTHAKKSTEATNLEADIKELNQQVADAIAQREKEAAEFGEQEKDLIQSIGALKSAITVLSKHNKGFLQEATTNEIRDKYGKFITKYESKLSPSQRQTMQAFLQQPSSAAYSSQSGEIFGILESMLDEMSADLSDAGKDEAAAQAAFAKMKETKTKIIEDKTSLLQEARETAAQAEEDAESAKQAQAACATELERLTEMKASAESTCESGKHEYAERSKTVVAELEAIDQAIGILDSEEAFAAFQKTTDAAAMFLQRSLQKLTRAKAVSKVVALLRKDAGDDFFNNYGFGKSLRSVAIMLQRDGLKGQDAAFQKILNAVGDQIKAKKKLLADKEAQKDTCVSDINKSDAALAAHANEIEKLEAKISQLTTEIQELEDMIKADKEEVEAITTSTKELSQERSEANAAYQKEMQENQAAVQLLEQAKGVLENFYGEKALIQQAPQFNEYNKNAGGNKVISMMDTIINDTKTEMKVATTSENAAQKAYETQVKNNNDAVKALKNGIATAEDTKAQKDKSKLENEAALTSENQANDHQKTTNKQLHDTCDFLLNNYKAITDAHQEEVDGLTQAKTILANVIADLA